MGMPIQKEGSITIEEGPDFEEGVNKKGSHHCGPFCCSLLLNLFPLLLYLKIGGVFLGQGRAAHQIAVYLDCSLSAL